MDIEVNSKDRQDCSSATPLHFAAQLGMGDVADLLIQKGANIEADTDSGTPLHWAISGPDPRHVVFISDRYAEVSSCQADGLIELVIPRGWIEDPIFETELFRWSPGKGVGVRRRGSDGSGTVDVDTVWIAPVPGRDLDTVRLLIKRGADSTAITPYGLAPLHLVSIPGCECDTESGEVDSTCPSLALTLIDAGADINAVDEDGYSVLDWADCLHLKAVLISKGAQRGCPCEEADYWES